jgi:hypothetical protein
MNTKTITQRALRQIIREELSATKTNARTFKEKDIENIEDKILDDIESNEKIASIMFSIMEKIRLAASIVAGNASDTPFIELRNFEANYNLDESLDAENSIKFVIKDLAIALLRGYIN